MASMTGDNRQPYILRVARCSDIPALKDLIRLSAHGLSKGDYSTEQVDAALEGVFGVDTQLIADKTYFVIEHDSELVACGGWSFRATLYGSDDNPDRNPRALEPLAEPAKIRAFFVHPNHARRKLGRRLLDHCEERAAAAGFSSAELGATLPGVRLYEASGYVAQDAIQHEMRPGLCLEIVPMKKHL